MTVDELVVYRRDPNNGAGLWAFFVGEMPVHHFNGETAKVDKYMDRLRDELSKWREK